VGEIEIRACQRRRVRKRLRAHPQCIEHVSTASSRSARPSAAALLIVTAMIVDAEADEQGFTKNAFVSQGGVTLHSTEQHDAGWDRKDQRRRLHAKVIIACGEEADYVLAGSANVTAPGLYGRYGGEGNAEACLIREEPEGTVIDRLGLSVCLSFGGDGNRRLETAIRGCRSRPRQR